MPPTLMQVFIIPKLVPTDRGTSVSLRLKMAGGPKQSLLPVSRRGANDNSGVTGMILMKAAIRPDPARRGAFHSPGPFENQPRSGVDRRLMIGGKLAENSTVARLPLLNWPSEVGAHVVKDIEPAMNRREYIAIFLARRFLDG